ncbi:MAG TPA: hypothetical protein VK558_07325 [Patescibacteria group bacterium]|nr:hypothetical protein [Patescibacteria group bacterium]
MNRHFIVPVLAVLLVSTSAFAQTAPAPTAGGPGMTHADGGPSDHKGHHGHHGKGWKHHHDFLTNLPKPLTADAVKQAFVDQEAKRPHVGDVVEKDANTLTVQMVGPDGKLVHQFDIDRNTGAPHPTR